jgi:GT2 family glycosyltransferase
MRLNSRYGVHAVKSAKDSSKYRLSIGSNQPVMLSERNPLIRAKRRAGRVKRWIKRRWWERHTGKQYKAWLAQAEQTVAGFEDNQVPIAIIVPVFNPPVEFLKQALDSVLGQTARHWQLIVSDDGSTDGAVVAYLDAFTAEHAHDARVTVLRNRNGGISSALNAGLAMVNTSHVGWLDHDDALDPRCIATFSAALASGDVDVVYSDEDKIDAHGRHFELYAKPSFSPELLLTQMYLCHFTVFPTKQARDLGGFRSEMDGAQDFDMALRLLPHIDRVVHIPLPLYHWRAWSQSTAHSIEAKPWAQEATARVQRDHLERVFGGGSVTPSAVPGLNDVHPNVTDTPVVSVIIPTAGATDKHGRRLVDQAIASLRASEHTIDFHIIVVTTGAVLPIPGADTTIDYHGDRFNFAEAINQGRAAATGEYLLLLNDDTSCISETPALRLLEIAQVEGVGIVGAKLTYPDGRLQHVGLIALPSGPTHCWIGKPGKFPGYFGSTLTPRNYSAVTAAAMLVRTSVFDAVGGFDPVFARDFNDVDFCLRVQQHGYRVAWTPYAHFTHHEGASMARRHADPREAAMFQERWADAMAVDPFYSPALNPQLERLYEAL